MKRNLMQGVHVIWIATASLLCISVGTAAASRGPVTLAPYSEAQGLSEQALKSELAVQDKANKADIAGKLRERLGQEFAGVWFDSVADDFVIPVASPKGLPSIRDVLNQAGLGLQYRTDRVRFTWKELQSAHRGIDVEWTNLVRSGQLEPSMIRTGLSPRLNSVVVQLSSAADSAEKNAIERVASHDGPAVQVEEVKPERLDLGPLGCSVESRVCNLPLHGGTYITSGDRFCSTAFRAVGSDGRRYMLTAGHCIKEPADPAPLWFWNTYDGIFAADYERPIGVADQWHFPGNDWAKINVTGYWPDIAPWPAQIRFWGDGPEYPWPQNLNYPIYGQASSYPGQVVCHSGANTGGTCGTAAETEEETVEYGPEEKLHNLMAIRGKYLCIGGGDSGGPVFTAGANMALGIISGGGEWAECYEEGKALPEALFANINEATAELGVTIPSEISPTAPTVETMGASNVQEFQATIKGSVNPHGSETTYHFEYGKTSSYGNSIPIPEGSAGTGQAAVERSATLGRLSPGTTYHFRIVASNAGGSSFGSDLTFHTPGFRYMRGLSSGSGISSWEAAASQSIPSPMAVGDFTGDGKADVLSVGPDENGHYRYMLGSSNGTGVSSWSKILGGMGKPDAMALGDLTGDGKADIVAVEPEGNGKYRYMLGVSSGTGISSWGQILGGMSAPTKLAVGDFTGDKKADIVAVEPEGNGKYRYMLGVSNGAGISTWGQVLTGMSYAEFLDLGDVNADGKADIGSVESEGSGKYRYMFGISSGTGVASWNSVLSNVSGPYFFNLDDFNGDGKADIVSLESEGSEKYRYMLGVSSGTGISSWGQVLTGMSLARQSDIGDLTGDGKADIVSLETESSGSYSYRLGVSSGTGVSSWQQMMGWMRRPYAVDFGDLTGDKKADIVAIESEGNGKYRYAVGISGAQGITTSWTQLLSGMSLPANMALGDLTGDGKADIVAVEPEGNGKYRYMLGVSSGTGISSWSQILGGMSSPSKLAVGDFTGDKKADIVAVEPEGNGKYRYMLGVSNGAGISTWGQVLGGLSYPEKMTVGDVNGDGKVDILQVESEGNEKYRYMLGISSGTGISSWSQILGGLSSQRFVDAGDFNGDGKADVLSVESEGNGKYRFMRGLSNGAGISSWTQLMGGMSGPSFFNAGDGDGDGKADLLSLEAIS